MTVPPGAPGAAPSLSGEHAEPEESGGHAQPWEPRPAATAPSLRLLRGPAPRALGGDGSLCPVSVSRPALISPQIRNVQGDCKPTEKAVNSISRTTKETEGTRKRTGVGRADRTRLRPPPRALRTRTSDHVALGSGSVRVWGRSPDPAAWHRLSSRPGPCPPSSPARGQRGAGPASPRALCLPRARRSEQCARSLGPPPPGPRSARRPLS